MGLHQVPHTVLVVDDEEAVRLVMIRALEERRYRVVAAVDGAAAWELLQVAGGTIHAVVTDVVMPRMGGQELAARVRTLPQVLPLLFISGYGRANIHLDHHPFLAKPFHPDQLADLVAQLLSDVAPTRGA